MKGGVAALAAVACVLQACAVKEDGGKLHIGVDNAQLLGQTVASFRLADGGDGSLRVLNGRYSVKLHNRLKVVPLESSVVVAKLLRAEVLDGRTVLFIETGERSCNYKMLVLSFQRGEVISWKAGDCETPPVVAVADGRATIDFARRNRLTRYTYTESRLIRTESAIAPPAIAAAKPAPSAPTGARPPIPPTPASAVAAAQAPAAPAASAAAAPLAPPARKVASIPASPRSGFPREGGDMAAQARRDASIAFPPRRPAQPQQPSIPLEAPGVLTFPPQEQQPVRIVLDR